MKYKLLLITFFALFCSFLKAQEYGGYYFGLKGGLLLGTQAWNNFERDPLIKYQGDIFIENYEESGLFALFAQAGFHRKGSALRGRTFFSINGNPFQPPTQEFIFNNAVLTVGAKKKSWLTETTRWHYMFGLRGDYTISTNLDEYKEFNERNNTLFFPINDFVQDFNFGVMIGGGLEFDLGELVGAVLEFSVNPDFSFQYRQPAISNVYNPYTQTNVTIGERTIRNITFEVSAGFRFLRKVEYID